MITGVKFKYTKRSGFGKHLTIKNCDKTFGKSILKICRLRFDVWLTSLSSQKMNDEKSLKAKKDNAWWNVLKQRDLHQWNQSACWECTALLYEVHLMDEAVKFSFALFWNVEFHQLLSFIVFKHFFYFSLFDLVMKLAKRQNVVYKFLICYYEMNNHNFLSFESNVAIILLPLLLLLLLFAQCPSRTGRLVR